MTREEAHQAVREIESRPGHKPLGGGEASHALIDLIPEDALDLLGRFDEGRRALGHLGISGDDSGVFLTWFVPAPLSIEHLARSSFFVSAYDRDEALHDEVDWHGMPVGVVDVSRPEAAGVIASIFEHLNPAPTHS